MKHHPYMGSVEMSQLMYLSAMVQMCEKIIESTQDKTWLKRLKSCKTMLEKTSAERITYLDQAEIPKVTRRCESHVVRVYSKDDARFDSSQIKRKVTIDFEDLMELADGCILNCYSCPQGDVVKKCPRRLALHRLGLQCAQSRENPKKGECEWRYEDSVRCISPQYESHEELVPEQLP